MWFIEVTSPHRPEPGHLPRLGAWETEIMSIYNPDPTEEKAT